MAITTADGWFAAAKQRLRLTKTVTATTVATSPASLWGVAGSPGAGTLAVGNTTTGVVFTDVTAGAPLIKAFGVGETGYLAQGAYRGNVAGGMMLFDRIWGAGAVSMTALATTNFASQPAITQRLPGGNDYSDLEIILEFTTTVSATATTVSVGYTNQDGTTGRTTGASASLTGTASPRTLAMPLQAGDKGVQKIDSVTVGGTVASAGAFNVILARRVADFDVRVSNGLDLQSWDQLGAPVVFEDSCFWMVSQPDSTATGLPNLGLVVISG